MDEIDPWTMAPIPPASSRNAAERQVMLRRNDPMLPGTPPPGVSPDKFAADRMVAAHAEMMETTIQRFLNHIVRQMAPGTRAAAVFRHPKDPAADLFVSAIPFPILHSAVEARCKALNIQLPSKDAALVAEVAESTKRTEAMTAAVRRAIPFISGPGADTAIKILLAAIGGRMTGPDDGGEPFVLLDPETDCVPPIDRDTADTLAVMGLAFAANDKKPG